LDLRKKIEMYVCTCNIIAQSVTKQMSDENITLRTKVRDSIWRTRLSSFSAQRFVRPSEIVRFLKILTFCWLFLYTYVISQFLSRNYSIFCLIVWSRTEVNRTYFQTRLFVNFPQFSSSADRQRLTCPSNAIIASPLLEANAWDTFP